VLGMGHLVRSTAIARALAEKFSVRLVIGGKITGDFRFPANIELLQLPPLQTDADFSRLQVCDSSLGLEETKALRSRLLLDAFDRFQPDALITELYPFGRKQFAFELVPLLERAHNRAAKPLIISSIRDILVTKKDQAKHEKRVCKILNSFYDLVLVHGDANFQKLEETFARVSDLCCPVEYTGYVVQPKTHAARGSVDLMPNGKPAIVVSNGSGGCPGGHLLLENVLRAAQLLESSMPYQFHVFAGPLMPEDAYERLKGLAQPLSNVNLARYTPDLAGCLRRAELSISMAGYNTVMDILSTGVRALVFPETTNDDQEQTLRGRKLEKLGVLRVLDLGKLAPERFAREIREGLRSKPSVLNLNASGAENTSLLLGKYLAARDAGASESQSDSNSVAGAWRLSNRQETSGAQERSATCE